MVTPRRLALLALLACGGCTSITLSQLRPTFPAGEHLEARCDFLEPFRSEVNASLARAYRDGWRVAIIGQEVTSLGALTLSTAQVVCLERIAPAAAPAPAPPRGKPLASDGTIDPPGPPDPRADGTIDPP